MSEAIGAQCETFQFDLHMKLPGAPEPTILLSSRSEVQKAGLARGDEHPIIFSDKLREAHGHLLERGAVVTSIQVSRGSEYFEVCDLEGNMIEICQEP